MRELRKLILLWCCCCWCWCAASGDWVELPQFSDRDKVYGSPIAFFHKRDQLAHQKSNRRLYHQQPAYFAQDDSYYHHGEPDRHESSSFHRPYTESSWRNESKYPESHYQGSFEEDTEPSFSATIASFTTERVITSIVDDHDANIHLHDETILESSDEKYPGSMDESSTIENSSEDKIIVTSKPVQTTTTVLPSSTTEESKHSNETDDKGFLDYLPVDLLKKVHKTLKSQPATLKGKIRFLKAFESTLVDEIETRLSAALAPARVPRGARDEHDDSLGFPSLEGTLMAISFLTFAVYLVRLVMLLFRNTNNNIPPIFGRKKRSVEEFNEEAARILGYLESSFPRHYMK